MSDDDVCGDIDWRGRYEEAVRERDEARELAEGQLRAYMDLHHTYVEVYDQRNLAEQDAARLAYTMGAIVQATSDANTRKVARAALAAHEARVKGGAP